MPQKKTYIRIDAQEGMLFKEDLKREAKTPFVTEWVIAECV